MSAQSPRGKTGGENGGNPVRPRGENEENEKRCAILTSELSLSLSFFSCRFLTSLTLTRRGGGSGVRMNWVRAGSVNRTGTG